MERRSDRRTPTAPASARGPASRHQRQTNNSETSGARLSLEDYRAITSPGMPTRVVPHDAGSSLATPTLAKRQEAAEVKHDALMIVEQKAPNVLKMAGGDVNINRFLDSDHRHEALRTLPLAFPPVRFRRGETVEEYIDSVTKPWDELRRLSTSRPASRKSSVTGQRPADPIISQALLKNEQLRERHGHLVSAQWRQTHASKADIISGEEVSKNLMTPLIEGCTQAAIRMEETMVVAAAASCKEGVTATPRGLVVPYVYYESLLSSIHGAIDEAFKTFFRQAQDDEEIRTQATDDVTSAKLKQLMNPHQQGTAVITSKNAAGSNTAEVAVPPVGHPSRHSLVAVTTATNVALLWRMLEQVKTIVPGMETALTLFEQLLPMLYVDFNEINALLPNVACLAEQIKQLVAIPLVCTQLQMAEANEAQFRIDVAYLRTALENWGFTIWRNYNSIERRRAKHFDMLHSWFSRSQNRQRLSAVFHEWRFVVLKEKTNSSLSDMRIKYEEFVRKARHAAAEFIPMSTNRALATNQARFHAQRLAATAVHEKKGKSRPVGVPFAIVVPSSPPRAPTQDEKSPTAPADVGSAFSDVLVTTRGSPPQQASVPPALGASAALSASAELVVDDATSDDGNAAPTSESPPSRNHFFDQVLDKLQTVEDVSGHLREYIALQKQQIESLELEKRRLTERLKKAQDDALRLVEEKLTLNNTLQERELKIRDQLRQILRLKAKVRLHRHKNWRSASLRVLSDALRVSNATVEQNDKARTDSTDGEVQKDPFEERFDPDEGDGGDESEAENADPDAATEIGKPSELQRLFGRYAPLVLDAPAQLPDALVILKDWANNCLDDLQSLDGVGGATLSSRFSAMSMEVRDGILFSRLLFYLALPRYQPPLRNEELEDVSPDFAVNRARLLAGTGVQLHSPFPTYDDCFGDLPRHPPTKRMNILLNFASDLINASSRLSAAQVEALGVLARVDTDETLLPRSSSISSFDTGRRRQSTAFDQGDAKQRTKILLEFETTASATSRRRQSTAFSDAAQSTAAAGPVSSEFLSQYVDPLLLCDGSKSSVVTFLGLLYVRFSHAFNHKANCTVTEEIELMKKLLKDTGIASNWASAASSATVAASSSSPNTTSKGSPGLARAPSNLARPAGRGFATRSGGGGGGVAGGKLEQMLLTLEEEEKSPWQIFLDRCKPFFLSPSHAFVLDGNFWSATAIESAQMMEIFSSMVSALQRSLETHRWHITMMCLTPLIASTGMSRGCFSGMHASVALYLYQRSCEADVVTLAPSVVMDMMVQRREYPVAPSTPAMMHLAREPQGVAGSPVERSPSVSPMTSSLQLGASMGIQLTPRSLDENDFKESAAYRSVLDVMHAFMDDVCRVFLSRATINPTLLTPTMTLSSWRILWMDSGLCPEKLSIDQVTFVYNEACSASSGAVPPSRSSSTTGARKSLGVEASGDISHLMREMTFDDFYEGVLRVAHYRYAPVSLSSAASAVLPAAVVSPRSSRDTTDSPRVPLGGGGHGATPPPLATFPTSDFRPVSSAQRKRVYTPLSEAFAKIIADYLVPLFPPHSPVIACEQLGRGVLTHDLLRRRNAELLSVFQAYGKVHLGITALEKDDALRLVKDAGIATAELSYQVVSELFNDCCFKRTSADASIASLMDPHQVDGLAASQLFASSSIGGGGSIANFLPPTAGARGNRTMQGNQHIQQALADRHLLDFKGFINLLCVMCLYKYPNPFSPFHTRLDTFLDRCVIAPLRFRVEQIARARARKKSVAVMKDGATPAVASPATNSLQPQQRK